MLHRDQRTPFSDWWWTVDKLLLGAILALMLGGVILSLAASPPVATRIGLDPFHFFGRSFCLYSCAASVNLSGRRKFDHLRSGVAGACWNKPPEQ